jgi:hypothetical protein
MQVGARLPGLHDDTEFGYRFIADELAAREIAASRNRVNRLCTLQRIFSVHSNKRGTGRRPGPPFTMTSSSGSSLRRHRTCCD